MVPVGEQNSSLTNNVPYTRNEIIEITELFYFDLKWFNTKIIAR